MTGGDPPPARYRDQVTSMAFDAEAAAARVVAALIPLADAERATAARQYLKSDLDFLGVRTRPT